jgi:tetratricopeptide (TPR) repeat protein
MMICVGNLAEVADARGDYEAARGLLEESLGMARELGGSAWLPQWLNLLAWVEQHRGNWQRAAALCRESLEIARPTGRKDHVARALNLLGRVELRQGDLRAARALLAESLTLWRGIGRLMGIAECLESLAGLWALEEQPERAARCLGAAEAIREARGVPLPPSEHAEHDRITRIIRDRCSTEVFAAAWAEGRALTVEQAVAEALRTE